MKIWLLLAVMAAVAWIVLRPLLRGQVPGGTHERAERVHLQDLLVAKEATYTALREIEFDHLTHKLSEEDYQALRSQYRAQAIQLLKEIDVLQAGAQPGKQRPHRSSRA